MIGIYKITAPDGKIYIGQTVNYKSRIIEHKKESTGLHPRLFCSLNKFGFNNHCVQLIKEFSKADLNYWERHYQDHYDVLGENGLNCRLTKTDTKKGSVIAQTKIKMSISGKLKIFSEKHKANLSKSAIARDRDHSYKFKCVLHMETGIYYDSVKEAAQAHMKSAATLQRRLNGNLINKTAFKYA